MSKFFNRGFFIWFLISIFYAYQYIIRILPNVIAPIVISKFNITASALGQFSGLYYIGYAMAHIPIGMLLDKCGLRIVVSLSIILTVSGMLPLIYSDIWLYSQIGRVIVGIGSATSAIAIFKVTAIYYSNKLSKMIGISVVIGLVGGMSGAPFLYLIKQFGWDYIIFIYLVLGFILAVIFFIITPSHNTADSNDNIWNNMKLILCNKNVIIISLLGGLMVGPLEGFADGWATTFLLEGYNISYDTASFLPSVILLGMGFASLSFSYISGQNMRENFNVILFCVFIMLVAFLLLLPCYFNVTMIVILLFIIGFGCAYQVILTCNVVLYVNDNQVALATAISNMIVMIFGYFFHTVISLVLEVNHSQPLLGDQVIYGKSLLVKSLLVIPFGLLIGFFGCLWLKHQSRSK